MCTTVYACLIHNTKYFNCSLAERSDVSQYGILFFAFLLIPDEVSLHAFSFSIKALH